jgi:hypothetical protein
LRNSREEERLCGERVGVFHQGALACDMHRSEPPPISGRGPMPSRCVPGRMPLGQPLGLSSLISLQKQWVAPPPPNKKVHMTEIKDSAPCQLFPTCSCQRSCVCLRARLHTIACTREGGGQKKRMARGGGCVCEEERCSRWWRGLLRHRDRSLPPRACRRLKHGPSGPASLVTQSAACRRPGWGPVRGAFRSP